MNRLRTRCRRRQRDEGSALLLVLVLVVVGALIVVPLLDYAITVARSNQVLSAKTRRQEAVKAGLRVALTDPQELYRHCAGESGGSDTQNVAMPPVNDYPLETRCKFLAFSAAADESELHLGLAATKMGAEIPQALAAVIEMDEGGTEVIDPETGLPKRLVFEMDDAMPLDQWYQFPAAAPSGYPDYTRTLLSTPRRIWGPNLPVRHKEARSATSYRMPGPCGDTSCPPSDCQVYFPGTYSDPVTLSGQVFFTSGIYYFEDTVTVLGDADVVVGMGSHLGCTTDQQAAFYATDVPSPHNISGLGGTFVLGLDSRFIVSNEIGAPSLRFNQRYVGTSDLNSPASFGVSIVSVNGAVGGDGTIGEDGTYTLADLNVDGVIKVPGSLVGGVGLPAQYAELAEGEEELPIPPAEPADTAGYKPSSHTHAPRPPTAPTAVQVVEYRVGAGATDGRAYVTWEPPDRPGGLETTYGVEVRNSGGTVVGSCGPVTEVYECIVTGLPTSTGRPFRYIVNARNSLSTPDDIAAAWSDPPIVGGGSSPTMAAAPAAPTPPVIGADAVYNGTVRVAWEPVTTTGTTPIAKYTVTAWQEHPIVPPATTRPPATITTSTCTMTIPRMIADAPDPDWPDIIPVAPEPPNPPYCSITGLDPLAEYSFSVTAENVSGQVSANSAPSNIVAPVATLPSCDLDAEITATPAGCKDWTPPVRVVYPYEPDPIVDIILSAPDRADDKVVIDIPGLVAVPQGVFRLFNPHGLGKENNTEVAPPVVADGNAVQVSGGIVAASFRVRDGRMAEGDLTVPIGLLNPIVQRTYLLETCTPDCDSPSTKSTAVVQVNQNGAYAVNSWEVQ